MDLVVLQQKKKALPSQVTSSISALMLHPVFPMGNYVGFEMRDATPVIEE